MPLWRFLLVTLIAVMGLVSLTIWYFPTTQDYRSQNPFWNGLERFNTRYDTTSLASLSALPEDSEGTVLLVIPLLAPDEDDLRRLKTYVEDGGTLVLADDWGEGNVVLEGLGLTARFNGDFLQDPLFNAGDRRLPRAVDLTPSPITADVMSVGLNYATILNGPGILELVRSSSLSYLDVNANGAPDSDEPVGPFPVVGLVELGEGRLVLLSDPSIFVNAMLDKADNARLVENIIGLADLDPRVFVDQAHLPSSQLGTTKNFLGSVRRAASHPLPIAALIVGGIIIILAPIWRRREGETSWNEAN